MNDMLERLTDGFPVKLMGGILFLTFEKQLAMLLLFGILIFLDCLTRWIAISHVHLVSCGRQLTFLEAVYGIREARRQRLISSEIMKKRGTEKLILYNLCVAAGIVSDALLEEAGTSTGGMAGIVVSYLAATEALSVIENLSDAGVSSMTELLKKLRGR